MSGDDVKDLLLLLLRSGFWRKMLREVKKMEGIHPEYGFLILTAPRCSLSGFPHGMGIERRRSRVVQYEIPV